MSLHIEASTRFIEKLEILNIIYDAALHFPDRSKSLNCKKTGRIQQEAEDHIRKDVKKKHCSTGKTKE